MEKYLKIGERYVQWIALAIGLLYLGLVAYWYVLQPPLTVAVNSHQLLPGEVDVAIDTGSAKPVRDQMASRTVDIKLPEIHPKQDLIAALQAKTPATPTIAEAPLPPKPTDTKPSVGPAPTIPIPPPAIVAEAPASPSLGTSLLEPPSPAAAAVPPGVAVAPVAAGAAVAPVALAEDHDWITLPWAVRMESLIQAFKTANIPTPLIHTLFLRVELVRQEKSPAGQWSAELVMPPPPTVSLLPMPDESATQEIKTAYQTWAATPEGVRSVLQPDFFRVTSGTPWYPPGSARPVDSITAAPPPAAIIAAPPPRAIPGRPGLRQIPGEQRPGAELPPPLFPTPARGHVPDPHVSGELPTPTLTPTPQGPAAATTDLSGFVGGATGSFDPTTAPPEAAIYTHDWTVQGGHTYRYKLRYKVLNPLFLSNSGTQKDRDTLALTSPFSDWTDPVVIPSRFQFFVQKFQKNNNNDVFFDVFAKKPGVAGGVEKSTVRVAPGDSIGLSGSLLVDVRQTSDVQVSRRSWYFVITDPEGNVQRHDVTHDKDDPAYKDLLERTGGSAGVAGASTVSPNIGPTPTAARPVSPRAIRD